MKKWLCKHFGHKPGNRYSTGVNIGQLAQILTEGMEKGWSDAEIRDRQFAVQIQKTQCSRCGEFYED